MKYVTTSLSLILLLALSFLIGQCRGRKQAQSASIVQADTLYIRDTITQYEPKERVIRLLDTVVVPAIDTMRIHDTMYVYLERHQEVWRDSLCDVYVSGILPRVDSVRHYTTEKIVIKSIAAPKSHWGFGVTVGPSAGFVFTPKGWQPGVGISAVAGLTYSF